MRLKLAILICVFSFVLTNSTIVTAADPLDPPVPSVDSFSVVEKAILTSTPTDAERTIIAYLEEHPDSDHARFGLGVVQFLVSGEHLFQAAYRYGFQPDTEMLGITVGRFTHFPIKNNLKPESITYDQFDAVIRQWISDVRRAEATLTMVTDPNVELLIKPGLIRLDVDHDGEAEENEAFWRLFNMLGTRFQTTQEGAGRLVIAFDRGDVNWLRGYCHLCMAVGELMLAYDGTEMFNRVGHLAFAKPVTNMAFADQHDESRFWDEDLMLDYIAAIHLTSFPLRDPERPKKALAHIEAAIKNAKEMWRFYRAETDDYYEWVPNPKQHSVLPGAEVNEEMLATWMLALDETEALLAGKRLMRFWRETSGKGVNLRRVFTEPRRFDLILWVQGSDAIPYLEHGELTTPNTWSRLEDAFDQRIFRHGFWFN